MTMLIMTIPLGNAYFCQLTLCSQYWSSTLPSSSYAITIIQNLTTAFTFVCFIRFTSLLALLLVFFISTILYTQFSLQFCLLSDALQKWIICLSAIRSPNQIPIKFRTQCKHTVISAFSKNCKELLCLLGYMNERTFSTCSTNLLYIQHEEQINSIHMGLSNIKAPNVSIIGKSEHHIMIHNCEVFKT